MGSIGPLEIFVVLVVALLLFGSRLPNVARSFGKSITEFKKGMKDVHNETDQDTDLEEDAANGIKGEEVKDEKKDGV